VTASTFGRGPLASIRAWVAIAIRMSVA